MTLRTTRRKMLQMSLAATVAPAVSAQKQPPITRYVRYELSGREAYGILEGETVHELRGALLDRPVRSGVRHKLAEVHLLAPCKPAQVFAVGLNYKSHLGSSRPAPKNPEIFFKTPSCLQDPGGRIVIPPGTNDVHYEGELVVVMAKRTRRVSVEEAPGYVFGVTCGNDVSARDWQRNDLQWWRAKAADTFGPLGPMIVTGLDYGNVNLQTRLNGQVKQSANTNDLLFNVATVISFISQYAVMLPGDIIYTGTPGQTSAMKPGDVVEVEIEGIGVLRNVVA